MEPVFDGRNGPEAVLPMVLVGVTHFRAGTVVGAKMEDDAASDVYHTGERAVQQQAGVRERAEQMTSMVERTIPDGAGARGLIEDQPHVVVTSVDRNGTVWVSFLTGEPGFLTVPDDRTLNVATTPAAVDPLADHLRSGMPAGVLLVDPRNRNRLRLNGTVEPTEEGFTLTTEEVFPNCQKYIQQRSFERVADESTAATRETTNGLQPAHREWIETTDTFFIGSYYPDTGADASHRGGDPGFVDVDGDTIVYPDYPGNTMFCTLGNIESQPNVGLLFVDFADGRTLQVTGSATIIWDDDRIAQHEGAERLVEITVDRTVELPNGNPFRWSLEDRSPFNP
jgi:predicted pyridoxine 5'-phosphate oxidase superfamily flavin-nucleotide-binding protein